MILNRKEINVFYFIVKIEKVLLQNNTDDCVVMKVIILVVVIGNYQQENEQDKMDRLSV